MFYEKFAMIFLFRLNSKSTACFIQKYDFKKSKSTLPQQKISTAFRHGNPDFRQSNRKLGENIGYSERTFIQDFKNMGEKKIFLDARERYWRLDLVPFIEFKVEYLCNGWVKKDVANANQNYYAWPNFRYPH